MLGPLGPVARLLLLGTLAVSVNVSVAGGVTGPAVVGVNEIHDAAAGTGEAEMTSRCTSETVLVAVLIRLTTSVARDPPASSPCPPAKAAPAIDW